MTFDALLSSILNEGEPLKNIWFAGDFHTPPKFSYQVNFPRLEIVLGGEYVNEMEDHDRKVVTRTATIGDALYIPPNCWNKPDWDNEVSVLSILFGRKQMGLSLVSKHKGETQFYDIQKHSIQTRSGFAIDNILEALNALAREPHKKPMDELLLKALLEYSKTMLASPQEHAQNRVTDLYQGICIYIQENFHRPICRDSIAARFNISSNHLSRMFRQQGHMTLADYITWVRVERAKFMLKKYSFKLSDVAQRCGFRDVNYFCRVFKSRTGKTPTQYRTAH
ncbi:AraC family transcriptional regulator [Vibrio sp. SCSIO 43136]|uniref:AraC family transcriptional regulator n=1 Tax=Vibrio sp. SCSIO 43136 TaxID=2819101 RepID=UPI002074BD1F|nr:AraC family transcriptional regulator [Vibrio sp. SCSIO 43136]USD67388.1 helix-turn-helix transcriptional regulator [Vibrio sp. SCSIO 43136]